MVSNGDEEMANGRARVKNEGCRRRESDWRTWQLGSRQHTPHQYAEYANWPAGSFFFLSWIRRQELQRRIKSHYSTQGEADICKGGGGGEEEESKEHSLTTEIYNGWRVKYNHTNTLIFPHTLGDCSTFVLEIAKRENDNQTCTFIPYYGYLHILIGCFVDHNYLLEYRIPKRASGWRNKKKGQKKERRYAKALMIFRAATVCHLHDDNGQL